MRPPRPPPRSQLFTVRLWAEQVGAGRSEWRGWARHLLSGRSRSFRDWPALIAFLEQVAREEGERAQGEPPPHRGAEL